jgi:GTPase Era involved in 16S rRNA processing
VIPGKSAPAVCCTLNQQAQTELLYLAYPSARSSFFWVIIRAHKLVEMSIDSQTNRSAVMGISKNQPKNMITGDTAGVMQQYTMNQADSPASRAVISLHVYLDFIFIVVKAELQSVS